MKEVFGFLKELTVLGFIVGNFGILGLSTIEMGLMAAKAHQNGGIKFKDMNRIFSK